MFIVLPEFVLDRAYFHSACLRNMSVKEAGEGPQALILQITVLGQGKLEFQVMKGRDDQETRNLFIELLTQLATIDGQFDVVPRPPAAPTSEGGPASNG